MTDGNGGFGTRLGACRILAGLSQEELAERSGLSSRTIRYLESGQTSSPYANTVRRLADALELSGAARIEFIGAPDRRLAFQRETAPMTGEAGSRVALDLDRPDWVRAVPRQLPGEVRRFVGRAEELTLLNALAGEAGQAASAVVVVIAGKAGVGKTALAVHWARQAASEFSGGQLFADLRGFDPSGVAANPDSVLAIFLEAMGLVAGRLPAGLEARAALYRSLMHGQRMLVVLDNARDAAQVMPLLPASPGSMAVVTSRRILGDLTVAKDATPMTLEVMSPPEANLLLTARLGPAPAAGDGESSTTLIDHRELIELCGGLPLALCIVAARILANPRWPATALTGELPDVLNAGRQVTRLHAVFSWSYQQLSKPAAVMFRLLGICPATEIELAAVASLTGMSVTAALDAADELVSVHLIEENAPGQFAVHDLLREYAAELCHATDEPAERAGALTRLLDFYLRASLAAAAKVPSCFTIVEPVPNPGDLPEGVVRLEFRDMDQAVGWFGSARNALVAAAVAAAGISQSHAMGIALASVSFLHRAGHWNDCFAVARIAQSAASRLSDRAAEAYAHCSLGSAYEGAGDFDLAAQHLHEALALSREIGHYRNLGVIYSVLGRMSENQQQPAEGLRYAYRALESFRVARCRPGEAFALNSVGWLQIETGDAETALPLLDRALRLHCDHGDKLGQAATWDSIGYARHLLGNEPEALNCYQRALAVSRQLPDLKVTAAILDHAGDAHHACGHDDDARSCWQEALAIIADLKERSHC
jgi:tetratricopeptide (TPR) repeat protein/transcriptional regulator with XRE-family HTH domain